MDMTLHAKITHVTGPTDSVTRPGTRHGTIPIFAAACGIAVANVYFVQPLLDAIARGFDVSEQTAGLVSTAAQIGYALGLMLVVPLVDTANLRRLARLLLSVTSLALVYGAAAPGAPTLILATFVLATATVLPQIILPTAASLAAPGHSGRVVGAVSTGLILGVLLSRVVSGAVAEVSGSWRVAFLLSAVLTAALALILPRFMPERTSAGAAHLSYRTLLASLPQLFLAQPEVRLSALLGASAFAAFSAFWSTLAFHLAGSPFSLGSAYAGLFGLLGAPGALAAPFAGRLADRYGANIISLLALACIAGAFLVFGLFGATSLVAIVVGCNLLDFGFQSGQIANQTRVFRLSAEFRGRVNTIYMCSVFSGGALGSLVGVHAFGAFGWFGVIGSGVGFLAVAALGLAIGRTPKTSTIDQAATRSP
jgi:predicted MFS family arabinose efflux permease